MPTNGQRRTRIERVAALELPPNFWERLWERIQEGDVWLRVAMCAIAAVVMWGIIEGWNPPFPYRTGFTPQRDIVSRTLIRAAAGPTEDRTGARADGQPGTVLSTSTIRRRSISSATQLKQVIGEFGNTAKFAELREAVWAAFRPRRCPTLKSRRLNRRRRNLTALRALADTRKKLKTFENKLAVAFTEIEKNGILEAAGQADGTGCRFFRRDSAATRTSSKSHPPGNAKWPLQVSRYREVSSGRRVRTTS